MVNKFKPKDTDKDGVIDFLDCEPNNPKEHGLFSSLAVGAAGSFVGTRISKDLDKRRRAQKKEEFFKKKRFFK